MAPGPRRACAVRDLLLLSGNGPLNDTVEPVPLLDVVPVRAADRSVVRRLLQLYLHDCSEVVAADVDEHGEFAYPYLDHYWTEPDRHPFLIRTDGQWAGFALVRACPHWDMAEFFVLRRYRRLGIGQAAARAVLALFPGHWEVRQVRANPDASAFWRAVIPYDFAERETTEGVAQTFVVP